MRKYIIPAVAITAFLAAGSVSMADTSATKDISLAIANLDTQKWLAMAAALVLGLAAALGTIAQSITAKAGLEGTARNPNAASKIFTPMVIAMSLIEALVISAFIIAFTLIGKIK